LSSNNAYSLGSAMGSNSISNVNEFIFVHSLFCHRWNRIPRFINYSIKPWYISANRQYLRNYHVAMGGCG